MFVFVSHLTKMLAYKQNVKSRTPFALSVRQAGLPRHHRFNSKASRAIGAAVGAQQAEEWGVFVEYAPQTRIEGEIQQMEPDFPVAELWALLTGVAPGRTDHGQVTIVDSVGFASRASRPWAICVTRARRWVLDVQG